MKSTQLANLALRAKGGDNKFGKVRGTSLLETLDPPDAIQAENRLLDGRRLSSPCVKLDCFHNCVMSQGSGVVFLELHCFFSRSPVQESHSGSTVHSCVHGFMGCVAMREKHLTNAPFRVLWKRLEDLRVLLHVPTQSFDIILVFAHRTFTRTSADSECLEQTRGASGSVSVDS